MVHILMFFNHFLKEQEQFYIQEGEHKVAT